MSYYVVFDGNCHLCVNLVKLLESLDQGKMFNYVSMQDQETLSQWEITPEDCEQGMILIDANAVEKRWQGSAAAEEIGKLLPMGNIFVDTYRTIPGIKWVGDRIYEQIRDNRYTLFGKRTDTYKSAYCVDNNCKP